MSISKLEDSIKSGTIYNVEDDAYTMLEQVILILNKVNEMVDVVNDADLTATRALLDKAEAMIDEIITYQSDGEVLEARSTYESLNARLTAIENEVDTNIINITSKVDKNKLTPKLMYSFMGAPFDYRYVGNSDHLIVPHSFYQVYNNRYKTTGGLYAIEKAFSGRTTQKVIRSYDGGKNWKVLGELPSDINAGERIQRIYVESTYQTFYILKEIDINGDPGHYNVISYSYNESTGVFTQLGVLDIGYKRWHTSGHSIDSALSSVDGSTVTMFAEYCDEVDYVKVWRTKDKGVTWTAVLTIEGMLNSGTIRHFHVCQNDPFNNVWYVAAGDSDSQCRILTSANDGGTWVIEDSGTQELRTLGFVFESDYVYYGMDTPQNDLETKIFRFTRGNLVNREHIGTQTENAAIRAVTRTYFPSGFLIFSAIESTSLYNEYVTTQFYSYDTKEFYEVGRFYLKGELTGGFHDAPRYQDKFTGIISLELYQDSFNKQTYEQFASGANNSSILICNITEG